MPRTDPYDVTPLDPVDPTPQEVAADARRRAIEDGLIADVPEPGPAAARAQRAEPMPAPRVTYESAPVPAVREQRPNSGLTISLPNFGGDPDADLGDMDTQELKRELRELANRLSIAPERPTWGPKVESAGRRGVFGWLASLMQRRARADGEGEKPEPAERPDPATGLTPGQRTRIDESYELSRRIYRYGGLYALAALLSAVIAALALYVDYEIIHADIWTRALSDEFGVVPAGLAESVMFKSLQVVFATLAVHFMLKLTEPFGRYILTSIVFVLAFVMVLGVGFVVANNNLAAGTASVTATGAETTRLGDALSQLGLSENGQGAAAGAAEDPRFLPVPSSGRCPDGYRRFDETRCLAAAGQGPIVLDLQDWFLFRGLPQEWRQNAQLNLWLIFVSMIFFIVTAVAALYIHAAERNVRNYLMARDHRNRARDYARFQRVERRLLRGARGA